MFKTDVPKGYEIVVCANCYRETMRIIPLPNRPRPLCRCQRKENRAALGYSRIGANNV